VEVEPKTNEEKKKRREAEQSDNERGRPVLKKVTFNTVEIHPQAGVVA
jgi:hypothetical protein